MAKHTRATTDKVNSARGEEREMSGAERYRADRGASGRGFRGCHMHPLGLFLRNSIPSACRQPSFPELGANGLRGPREPAGEDGKLHKEKPALFFDVGPDPVPRL